MYEIKELLTDLGLQCSPELISQIATKYNVFKKENKNPMQYTAEYVCFMNSITLDQFKSRSRFQNIIIARREFMYLLYSLGYQVVTIASFLNCDHSNVVHHVGDMNDKFSINPKFKRNFMEKYNNILNNQIIKDFAIDASFEYKYKAKYLKN